MTSQAHRIEPSQRVLTARRIGLDITLLTKQRTGVENYTGFLAEHLPAVSNELEFIYFSAAPIRDPFSGARVVVRESSSYAWWRQTALPRLLNEHKIDLFHSPFTAVPLVWNGPVLATIHDVTWSRYPETYSVRRRVAHRIWCALAVRKATCVIVPSQSTALDLERLHPRLARHKTVIIRECSMARAQSVCTTGERDDLFCRLKIVPPFLLAVGTIQPRKNYERLIAAFDQLRRLRLPRHQLVIVGRDGFAADRVRETITQSAFANDIRLVGYLPDKEISWLYDCAAAFVYPSLYEGFGLPLLEAMARGTPVASSNASSLPEVAGDAAVYFCPTNPEEMSQALHRLLTDHALREELIQKGRERVKIFTPRKMASETVDLYREVLARHA